MHCYDFKNIDPLDFETLTNDLLSKHLKVQVERFKPGKDLGVDGRFFIGKDRSCIIQSKHYAASGYRQLISDLKNKEKKKVVKLEPERYILSTSVPLSPANKTEIMDCFAPYIKSTSDIFGKDDLNSLISDFPGVERNHYKLWIATSEVLRTLLNAATYNLSEQTVRGAVESSNSYVVTNAHKAAIDKILQTKVLVITGEPGVGKTTLAEQVCLHFVADGYDLIAVERDIQDARATFNPSEKQIFYFDDFLGRNFLETLRFNEDTQIMKFIKLIQDSTNKIFVLTSRTNILDRGYFFGQFNTPTMLKSKEYVLKIKAFTSDEKARILYSFMWGSGLSQEYLETIIRNKKYMKIVNHRNYNPRILEFITSKDNCLHIPSDEYGDFVDRSLDNPIDVWDHPYSVQLDDPSRAFIDLVILGNSFINEEILKTAYEKFITAGQHQLRSNGPSDFYSVAKTLSRTFVNRSERLSTYGNNVESVAYYSPFNPSIADYVLNKYMQNTVRFSEFVLYFDGAKGLSVLHRLSATNDVVVKTVSGLIVDKLGSDIFSKGFDFVTRIGCLVSDDKFILLFKELPIDYVVTNIPAHDVDGQLIDFCDRLLKFNQFQDKEIAKLLCVIFRHITSYFTLEKASDFAKSFTWSDPLLTLLEDEFHKALIPLWTDDYGSDFLNDNVEEWTEYFETHYEIDGEYCEEQSWSVDEGSLALLIADSTSDLFSPIAYDEVPGILLEFDLEDIAQEHFQSFFEDEHMSGSTVPNQTNVEGIFEGFIESKFS